MDRKEMQNTRLYLLAAFLVLALVAYLFVLYDVQVIHHDDYAAQAIRSIVRTEKVEASRGIITDRNGKPLVSNRSTYDLTFDAALLPPGSDSNEAILRLVQLCQQEGVAWSDNLPVSRTAPYRYTVDQMDSQQKQRFLTYLKSLGPCEEALGQYLLRHPDAVTPPEPEEGEEEAPPLEELPLEERAEKLLDCLTAESQRGELRRYGRSSGGGGHWQAEYAHLRAPVRPGDDNITLRYVWLGETVLIDVPLPEEAGS